MSVYGKTFSKVNEKSICNPISFYGISKLSSEKYIELYSRIHNINFTILRLFNIYGPGQDFNNTKQGMISIYLSQFIF